MMARRLNSKSPRVPRACRLRTYSPSNERLPAAEPGLTRRGQGQLHFTNIRNGRPDQIGAPVLLSSHISRGTAIPGCALFIGGLPSRRDALWTTSGFRGGGLQSAIVPSLLCRSRSQTDDQELVLVSGSP